MIQKNEIQKEALDVIKKHDRCTVVMSMGLGKTLLGLLDMAQSYNEYSSFLVVAPKVSIYLSWIEDAKKFDLEHLLEHITFTTYRSLSKKSLHYQKIYLDECHNLLPTHKKWLKSYSGAILGLTGTPPTIKDKEKHDLVSSFCPVVYTKNVSFAVDNKILNDYKIYIHHIDLDKSKNTKFGKGYASEEIIYKFWSNKLSEEINSPRPNKLAILNLSIMRMRALQTFASKTNYAKKFLDKSSSKTIVFANTKKQADSICKTSYYSGKANAEKNLVDFKSGKIMQLSCVLQLSEGITIPELKRGIILHAYGNNRKSSQRIGRLLRLNPNETSEIHILCYRNTIDEKWVSDSLLDFDQTKIQILC